MALIRCPECEKEVSDKAKACPNCGCPIANGKADLQDRTDRKVGWVILLVMVLCGMAILAIILLFTKMGQAEKQKEKSTMDLIENESIAEEVKTDESIYADAKKSIEEGNYANALELLECMDSDYLDVKDLKNQVLLESHILGCYEDLKYRLKNPDSFSLSDVEVYFDSFMMTTTGTLEKKSSVFIALIGTAQNGFGGNSNVYGLYTYEVRSKGTDDITFLGVYSSLSDYSRMSEAEEKIVGNLTYLRTCSTRSTNYDINRLRVFIKEQSYVPVKIIE